MQLYSGTIRGSPKCHDYQAHKSRLVMPGFQWLSGQGNNRLAPPLSEWVLPGFHFNGSHVAENQGQISSLASCSLF